MFLKECIPFILQACIKLIKSDSKDIYNITEYFNFFESSFHQRMLKNIFFTISTEI